MCTARGAATVRQEEEERRTNSIVCGVLCGVCDENCPHTCVTLLLPLPPSSTFILIPPSFFVLLLPHLFFHQEECSSLNSPVTPAPPTSSPPTYVKKILVCTHHIIPFMHPFIHIHYHIYTCAHPLYMYSSIYTILTPNTPHSHPTYTLYTLHTHPIYALKQPIKQVPVVGLPHGGYNDPPRGTYRIVEGSGNGTNGAKAGESD